MQDLGFGESSSSSFKALQVESRGEVVGLGIYRGFNNYNKVFGVCYTSIIIRSPQTGIGIITAPT